jgi:hypothetical protein
MPSGRPNCNPAKACDLAGWLVDAFVGVGDDFNWQVAVLHGFAIAYHP